MNDAMTNTEAPNPTSETADTRDVSYIQGEWKDELGNALNDDDTIASESGEFTLRVRNYERTGGIDIYFDHRNHCGKTRRKGSVLPGDHVPLDVYITSSAEPDSLIVYSLDATRITLTLTKKGNK